MFDPAKLSGCVDSLFHVSGDFHGDRSGGSFLGSKNGKLFEVDFNTSSYTLSSLRRETRRADAIGFSERGGGWTVFIASDFAKNPATLSVVVTAVEIHELGNKLAEVFIRNPRLFPKAKSNWLRRFDSDAGMALEECVFKGGVSTNTGRVTTNP